MWTPGGGGRDQSGGGGGQGGGRADHHTHKVDHADTWCTHDLVITSDGDKRIVEIKAHTLGAEIDRIANEVRNSGGTLSFHITYPGGGGSGRVENAMCPC